MRFVAALIASLTLPFGGVQWWGVTPTGHSLLLTGSPPSGTRCAFYVVDLSTFAGRGPYVRACGRPPTRDHELVPTVADSRTSPYFPVSVAGRVVMRYADASDTRPEYAWYGRSLWIYDVATTDGPEALRLDARTGAVLQRTRLPRVFRPVLAANADGLWLDPATNGGIDGVSVAPLLHVAFGAAAARVVHRGGRAAVWLAASAHTVWLEQVAGRTDVSIWRIDGTRAKLLARPSRLGVSAAYGAGRLWELACGTRKAHLLRVGPDTGALTPVADLPLDSAYCDASLTAVGDRVAVLDGPKLYVYR